MINGLSVGGGQQVTPAGAAIKLHFAYNNNTNNSSNSSNNNTNNSSNNNNIYSGLKTTEEKMSNNNNTGEVLKIIEKIRETSGATGGNQGSVSFMGLSTARAYSGSETPKAVGFIQGSDVSRKSATFRGLSTDFGSGTARAPGINQESGDSITPRGFSTRSGAGTPSAISIGPRNVLYEELATKTANGISEAVRKFYNITETSMVVGKLSLASAPGTGTGGVVIGSGATRVISKARNGVAVVQGGSEIGTSSLRWLPMPVTKEQPLNVGGDETKPLGRASENVGSPGEAAKSALVNPQPQRTEDQENAFRRIEDVHNYAKLQDYSSDTEEEEDEEEEELDEEEEDEEEIQVQLPVQQEITRIRREAAEEHVDVDVVTVPQQEQDKDRHKIQQQQDQPADNIRPEHHARRPMNAFLIFCKRHRGIVKERYKTLENRAITKILGDWWAALDEQEKHCFTDLAQQNKDAFFNANPNFKWYKLPAPPLRTLATRPSNTAAGLFIPSEDQPQQQVPTPLQLQWAERGEMPRALLRRNYFKLADETQMGHLSSLLQVQVQEKDFALQQALSETSQFLSAHMPGGNPNGNGSKRSLADSNSSNSSEEEAVNGGSPSKKAKSSRSCKGKIYQELVNSGQLAAIAKKSKARSPPSGNMGVNFVDIPLDAGPNTPPVSPPERQDSSPDSMQKHLRTVSESSSSGFFDLEEKIKELPALSLDAYLQRKRSTKKKKKFSGSKKPRNSNSTSSGSMAPNAGAVAATDKGSATAASEHLVRIKQQQQQLQAVGSQRRKARKESITRRDVSAIEQEVASILPLTINGSYYFNQSGAPKAMNAAPTSSSASPPLSSNSSSSSSSLSSQAAFDVTSSTSDLLILAEVAANRTELTKSN